LATTVQYLVFEPGLYALELAVPRTTTTDIGLRLPAIRLDTAPPTRSRPGRATVVGPTQEGWIWRSDETVSILVVGGQAGLLLTIYRATDGMAAPEIRFRTVHPLTPPQAALKAAAATASQAADRAERAEDAGDPGMKLNILAHVSAVGDVRGQQAQWLGAPDTGKPIEGFSISPPALRDAKGLEYQAILGNNWNTPWFAAGEYCGSRGLMLPLLGYRLRLTEAAAAGHECVYWGRFDGGRMSGPHKAGEACQAGDAPLEAMQVVIRARQAPVGGGVAAN